MPKNRRKNNTENNQLNKIQASLKCFLSPWLVQGPLGLLSEILGEQHSGITLSSVVCTKHSLIISFPIFFLLPAAADAWENIS